MEVNIASRNDGVTRAMQDYAREKLGKLDKYYNRVQSIQVILDVEKERNVVEGIVALRRGGTLVAKGSDPDMHMAVDHCMDKLHRQLVREKEKLHARRARNKESLPEESSETLSSEDEE